MKTGDSDWATNPAKPSLVSGNIETDDFDQIRSAFAKWDQRYDQLDQGRFEGRFSFAFLGDVQLIRISANRVIRSTGACPRDCLVFTPVTPQIAASTWRGRTLKPGMVNVLASSMEMDHRTCLEYAQASLIVPLARLEQVSLAVLGIGCDRLLPRGKELTIGDSNTDRLTNRLSDSIQRWVQPGLSGQTNLVSQVSLDQILVDLVAMLGESRIEDPLHTTSSQRAAVVRKIEEFVRENPGQSLGILDLCKLSGVSKRTLHYAFLEVTGCSPHDFIKAIKLNAARRDLKNLPPTKGQIDSVARSYGFHRSGRFAADFRRRFNKLPSAFLGWALRRSKEA